MILTNEVSYIGTTANAILKKNTSDDMDSEKTSLNCLTEGHGDIITAIDCHPSTSQIITVCCDGSVLLHDYDAHCTVWKTRVNGNASSCVFHPDGHLVVVCCQDGSIHLMFSPNGEYVDKYKESHVSITSLQFSPDGNMLAVGQMNGCLSLFYLDKSNTELEFRIAAKVCTSVIEKIDWSVDNTFLRVQSDIDELILCKCVFILTLLASGL